MSDRNKRQPPRHHHQHDETSEDEEFSPATRQPQKQPKQKEYDELSDSSTDSFNALRLQMLQKKKAAITKPVAAVTKQAAAKTTAKRNSFKQPKTPDKNLPKHLNTPTMKTTNSSLKY